MSHSIMFQTYSSVSTKAASYYDKDIFYIDLLSSIIFYIGVPMGILSAWIYDQFGMRFGLFLGIFLTFVAGVLRSITAVPGIYSNMERSTLYWICFCGQCLVGIGTPLGTTVTTKLTQNWFSGGQQIFATILLATSPILGVFVIQGFNPSLVRSVDDISTMNWVWSIPAVITMVLFSIFIRTSLPQTPPSRSAALATRLGKRNFRSSVKNFLSEVKQLLFNPSCVVLYICLGSVWGAMNAISIKMEQFTCSRGYSNTFSGSTVAIFTISGIVGTFCLGFVANKTGKLKEVIKFGAIIAALFALLLYQSIRKPSMEVAIILFGATYCFFSFGINALSLEFNVELTYPIEQATGSSLIVLASNIAGSAFTLISQALEQNLCKEAIEIQVCAPDSNGNVTGKDHTYFYLFMSIVIAVITVAWVILVKGDYKRQIANK
jgi:FLVCR family MFS transporter 7